MDDATPEKMTELQWELLLERISEGECTPFLGAGACRPHLPEATELANDWARRFSYPFRDCDLASVSQFIAVETDALGAKNLVRNSMQRRLERDGYPDFARDDNIHGVLARLPLPIYMTTNYDDFILRALKWANEEGHRSSTPIVDYCRWHRGLRKNYRFPDIEPSPEAPLVYHLHGVLADPSSIVLTEDDYEDFIVETTSERSLIPEIIKEAISRTPLLFVGYSLRDWNFRVILRAAVKDIERTSRVKGVTVQLSPSEVKNAPDATKYLKKKFGRLGLEIYWGTAQQFATELARRWQQAHGPRPGAATSPAIAAFPAPPQAEPVGLQ